MAAPRHRPTGEDAQKAIRIVLGGLHLDRDISELISDLSSLHPRHDTFPGEVLVRLGADALDEAGVSTARPLDAEGIRDRFLPECEFRGRDNHKIGFALLAAAAMHGGVEPDLLDDDRDGENRVNHR